MLRTTLKGLLAQRLRLLLTAVAVVLGVGFLTATSVLSDSIRNGADAVFGSTAEKSDAEVRSAPAFAGATGPDAAQEPLPEDVVNRIRAVDGVAEAAGLVQGYAQILDKDGDKVGSLTSATVGGSAAGLGTVSPFELASGRAPAGAGEVVVDVATARDAGLRTGDEVTILFTGPARRFRIVGTVTYGGKEDAGREHLRPLRPPDGPAGARPPGAGGRRRRLRRGGRGTGRAGPPARRRAPRHHRGDHQRGPGRGAL